MGSIDDVVRRLRQVLSRLDDLDFFPPWGAVSTIAGIVGEVVEIATQAPDPEPDDVDTCAAAWRSIQGHLSTAHSDLGKVAPAAPATVWDGDDAAGFRKTVIGFAGRVDTAEGAADSVATALVALSGDMTAARERHDAAYGQVLDAVSLDWDDFIPSIDLNPLNGLDAPWPTGKFVEIVEGLIATVRELLGSYEDAADALRTAARDITKAMDGIDLPTTCRPPAGSARSTRSTPGTTTRDRCAGRCWSATTRCSPGSPTPRGPRSARRSKPPTPTSSAAGSWPVSPPGSTAATWTPTWDSSGR